MPVVYLGTDHGGFPIKDELAAALKAAGCEVRDCGVFTPESVDYPDIARDVCQKVAADAGSLGVLVCGTGIGMSIAANKMPGIRAALCSETYSARMARAHNDANVLCLGARVIGVEVAREIVRAFLESAFEGGRHERRVAKIAQLEHLPTSC